MTFAGVFLLGEILRGRMDGVGFADAAEGDGLMTGVSIGVGACICVCVGVVGAVTTGIFVGIGVTGV